MTEALFGLDMAQKSGRITVYTGPMFSAKSELLIRELGLARIVGEEILAIKPRVDNRTSDNIASRRWDEVGKNFIESSHWPAVVVNSVTDVWDAIDSVANIKGSTKNIQVLAIDEAQFMDEWLVYLVEDFAYRIGLKIYIAGLDLDAWRRPFGRMPKILAMADEVVKTRAICFKCKSRNGRFTQKLGGSSSQVEVGDFGLYEARCFKCWTPPEAEAS